MAKSKAKPSTEGAALPLDAGLQAAKRFARVHDTEPGHAFQVCKTVLDLFAQTGALHGLGHAERRILAAAAMMHDTGYGIEPLRHHKGARDLILKSELAGFTATELKVIACVARYHRKAHPKPGHAVYADLDPAAQALVGQLAALLRIADGLDRSHTASARRIRVERDEQRLRIYVQQRHPCPSDLAAAENKRQLFEEVFGLKVEILLNEEAPSRTKLAKRDDA